MDYHYDQFQNSKRFQEHCRQTDFKCPKCGEKLVEIYRRAKRIYGYYCLDCDKDELGMVEWKIKVNS